MAISFAAVLDVLPASDCPRYTQKYLFPSSVSANPCEDGVKFFL